MSKLDEAIRVLREHIEMQAAGKLSVNYGTPIGLALLGSAHDVLDLLAEKPYYVSSDWFHGKRKPKMAAKESEHVTIMMGHLCAENDARGHANTFPEAVLSAVDSDGFKKWREEQK